MGGGGGGGSKSCKPGNRPIIGLSAVARINQRAESCG